MAAAAALGVLPAARPHTATHDHALRVQRPATSLRGFGVTHLRPGAPGRGHPAVCSASSSPSPDSFLRSQSEKLRRWAEEQRVQERVDAAAQAAAQATSSAVGSASEAAGRFDRDYDVSRRVSTRWKVAVDWLESNFGVQRRFRVLRQDVVRKWPAVSCVPLRTLHRSSTHSGGSHRNESAESSRPVPAPSCSGGGRCLPSSGRRRAP